MTSPKKEYLIKIFLKRARYDVLFETLFNYRFDLLKSHYKHISQENIDKIKEKYNYDEFCNRICPSIENEFSVEELEEINKFLSSSIGKKMMSDDFGSKIRDTIENVIEDMDRKMLSLDKGRNF